MPRKPDNQCEPWAKDKPFFRGSKELRTEKPTGVFAPRNLSLENNEARILVHQGLIWAFECDPSHTVQQVKLEDFESRILYADYAETGETLLRLKNPNEAIFVRDLETEAPPAPQPTPTRQRPNPNEEVYKYLKKIGGLYRQTTLPFSWYYSTTYRVLKIDPEKFLEVDDNTRVYSFTEVKPGDPIGPVKRVTSASARPLYEYQGNKCLYIEVTANP